MRAAIAAGLARYQSICPDWPAFRDAIARPQPVTLWAHPERLSPAALERQLADAGFSCTRSQWDAALLRLVADAAPAHHWGYFAGLFQIQEESARLAVKLLDPRPDERVLDVCAAPGNKTAQIALAMENRGLVVANELQSGRLPAIRQLVRRLGLRNVLTTRGAGESLPANTRPFDRVLVDAPCSGEGTWRKYRIHRRDGGRVIDDGERDRLARRQRRLLRHAVGLVRPGGRIVYATCTLAPEENEAVVDAVLRDWGDAVTIEPAHQPALPTSPGVTEWRGRRFDPRLAGTCRVWPGAADVGGFYVAVLTRKGPAPSQQPGGRQSIRSSAWPDHPATRALEQRFALNPEALRGLTTGPDGGRYLHYRVAGHEWSCTQPMDAFGIAAIGLQVRPVKPTTGAALWLAPAMGRNVLELTEAGLNAYRRRLPIAPEQTQPRGDQVARGFVVLTHQGYGVGVGRVGDGRMIESHYPKAWVTGSPAGPAIPGAG
jgi:16S rRNA C967 or C1407 C5-methylase (RsmB/RsmF family)/NOL1/NOP2/fmu family ribosome biogenesis protein